MWFSKCNMADLCIANRTRVWVLYHTVFYCHLTHFQFSILESPKKRWKELELLNHYDNIWHWIYIHAWAWELKPQLYVLAYGWTKERAQAGLACLAAVIMVPTPAELIHSTNKQALHPSQLLLAQQPALCNKQHQSSLSTHKLTLPLYMYLLWRKKKR